MEVVNKQGRREGFRQQYQQQSKIDTLGRIQPQDKDLEEAVLGAIMLEKDAYTVVCDILHPGSFYEPSNQKIYSAIQSLGAAQRPIDMLTVMEQTCVSTEHSRRWVARLLSRNLLHG